MNQCAKEGPPFARTLFRKKTMGTQQKQATARYLKSSTYDQRADCVESVRSISPQARVSASPGPEDAKVCCNACSRCSSNMRPGSRDR